MRMVRWMCNVKVKGKVRSEELKEKLGIEVCGAFGRPKGVHGVWLCRVVLRVYMVCVWVCRVVLKVYMVCVPV